MDWFTAFVVFVLVWWTVLFTVLPLRTRPQPEADGATGWRGAPARPTDRAQVAGDHAAVDRGLGR